MNTLPHLRDFLAIGAPLLLIAPVFAQEAGTAGSLPDGRSTPVWNNILEAYETARYAFVPNGTGANGFRAYNPGQDWTSEFDGSGFTIQPAGGAWSWGLQLYSFGFAGNEMELAGKASQSVDGEHLQYEWTNELSEWYVNDTRGLEHGYTLAKRPVGGSGPLTFNIDVRGTLRAAVNENGTGVAFLDTHDKVMLNYSGLTVFDAEGVIQRASFHGSGSQLRLVIDEAQAKYPLTIDPVAQQAYLKSSNSDPGDRFGWAVAISGDLAIVSAKSEASSAIEVDGDQDDNSKSLAGAAYIFERVGGTWVQQAYLKALRMDPVDVFGDSVAISGNIAVVGAPGEDSDATGVNGSPSNNNAVHSGAAYIFERVGGSWTLQAFLKSSNSEEHDSFGRAVAVSGDTIVVGATNESSNATDVNGDQSDNSAPRSGAAYVFQRSGGVWSQQAYLKASNAGAEDRFGKAVAISGDTIVVSSIYEESNATGVDGDGSNNSASESGAAYIFERVGGVWSQQAYLKASNTDPLDEFGQSVAISGDRVVVGAFRESGSSTGVNGTQGNGTPESGAAYIFERAGGSWTQQAYLKASNTGALDQFGRSVAITDELVVIGAAREASRERGVNGDQANNSLQDAGAAYVFENSTGVWRLQHYVKASNTGSSDIFGHSVAASGRFAVVGAPFEDSTARGINGNESSNLALNSGAAYVFDLASPTANYCGSAVPNSSGQSARISSSGSWVAAVNDFSVHATGLPAGQFGYFLSSTGHSYLSNPGGSQGRLCLGVGAFLARHHDSVQNSGATGTMDYTLDLTNIPAPIGTTTIQAGETWHYQCWFRDQNPNSTSNFTNGLAVQFE